MNHRIYILSILLFLLPSALAAAEGCGSSYLTSRYVHAGLSGRSADAAFRRDDAVRRYPDSLKYAHYECDTSATYCDFSLDVYHPDSIRIGVWNQAKRDTSSLTPQERTQRFYDSLSVYSERNKFWKFVHGLIVVPQSHPQPQNGQVVDEVKVYGVYNGKTIAGIEFERLPIFYPARSYLEKVANAVHAMTSLYAIKRDLLFKVGQKFDAEVILRNKQLLRSRQYIADANFVVLGVVGDPSAVVIKVVTRDSWTISGDGSIRGLTGAVKGELYDANFLGTGDKFGYQLSLDWKNKRYEGSMFKYYSPNVLGSFYEANVTLGRSFTENYYGGSIGKNFIHPTDYELGAAYERVRNQVYVRYELPTDSVSATYMVHYYNLDLWAGGSWYKPKIKSSFYVLGRFNNLHYISPPVLANPDAASDNPVKLPIADGINPYFYNSSLYMTSVGFYRENFLTAKLIYGYGYDEYVATGYRAQLTFGYMDAQYRPGWYMGASVRTGGFTPIGYLMGDVSIGSFYYPPNRSFFRSALDMRLDYFTRMMGRGRFKVRQFVSGNYLTGWNRMDGFYEAVWFTRESGPREITNSPIGHDRLVLSTESVVFTPWQPLGFHTALFAFADVGFLGYNNNVFSNDFYSSVGVGIRMKNEMLVFGTIQLSLFVSFNKRGVLGNEWIMLTSERRLQTPRYIPDKPQIVNFR